MEIKMRDAILQGKDFEFEGEHYKNRVTFLQYDSDPNDEPGLEWILENQDKLVNILTDE